MQMLDSTKLHCILARLAGRRPLFHSEDDFKLELAWELKEEFRGTVEVRLERPDLIDDKRISVDITLVRPTRNPTEPKKYIELKYKTRKLEHSIEGDDYDLKDQSAQDNGRYDFLRDISRVEKLGGGFAVFLTNDRIYWEPGKRETFDREFRLHVDKLERGCHAWDSKARHPERSGRATPIKLQHSYLLNWKCFRNKLPDVAGNGRNTNNRQFRYLLVEVPPPRR